MTPKQAKELLPIIKAYSEGKEIQFRNKDTDFQWCIGYNFAFDQPSECYRIKPKTIKYKRYLEKALGNIFVAIYQQNEELLPEKHLEDSNDFLCWIDKEWQEVECPI